MLTTPDLPGCFLFTVWRFLVCLFVDLLLLPNSGRVGAAYFHPTSCILYLLEDTQESHHYDLTLLRTQFHSFQPTPCQNSLRKIVLEQMSPDVVLTSSKSDENFIDTIRDYCKVFFPDFSHNAYIHLFWGSVDTTNAIFQIRPYKEFNSTRGRDRLLYLNRLADLPMNETIALETVPGESTGGGGGGVSCNAYDFMSRRREETGDPTMKHWNASIRLSNFSCAENSPFCVSIFITLSMLTFFDLFA